MLVAIVLTKIYYFLIGYTCFYSTIEGWHSDRLANSTSSDCSFSQNFDCTVSNTKLSNQLYKKDFEHLHRRTRCPIHCYTQIKVRPILSRIQKGKKLRSSTSLCGVLLYLVVRRLFSFALQDGHRQRETCFQKTQRYSHSAILVDDPISFANDLDVSGTGLSEIERRTAIFDKRVLPVCLEIYDRARCLSSTSLSLGVCLTPIVVLY